MTLPDSLHDRPATPRLTPLGLDGMLVTFADTMTDPANRAALAFRAEIDAQGWTGLRETATSLCSAYLSFDPAVLTPVDIQSRLRELLTDRDWLAEDLPPNRTLWTIPASFEGDHAPQLADAADLAGLSVDAAVREICAHPLRALALGYAPGQAYLGQLDAHWDLARQRDLTPTVAEGAVVTAVRQVIVFATSGPTGWRQIGMTRFRAFRPDDSDRPIALAPGDMVQLRAVSRNELARLADTPLAGAVAKAVR